MKHLQASLTGLIALTALIATPVALLRSASAAERGSGGAAGEIAALRAELAALKARLDVQGSSVIAPFKVIGPNKQPLFEIRMDNGQPVMVLSGSGGQVVGVITASGPSFRLSTSKDSAAVVSLQAGTEGGKVGVGNQAGKRVAEMSATPVGAGRFIVSGREGGKVVGELRGADNGSMLSLYDLAGTARVQASASAKAGNITLFGDLGALAMSSGEGRHPSLDISDAAGTILFVAQVTKGGVGAVEVGPTGNGVAASLTGGRAASALVGKKP